MIEFGISLKSPHLTLVCWKGCFIEANPCPVIPPNARSPEPRQSNPGSTAWKCGWHMRRKLASRSSSPFSSPILEWWTFIIKKFNWNSPQNFKKTSKFPPKKKLITTLHQTHHSSTQIEKTFIRTKKHFIINKKKWIHLQLLIYRISNIRITKSMMDDASQKIFFKSGYQTK
jgi:hypothetical protein